MIGAALTHSIQKIGKEYKAPEISTGKFSGKEVDVFAVGVLLFAMEIGSPPFPSTADPFYKKFILDEAKFWSIFVKKCPKTKII